ncbi:thermonuclease family protein [Segetibacter aerophilus]|uniref:TNase-like domain-containing protein n=1 Tax=Segetibacter aerophilus TaxID=670293 RepID=A0A512BIL3_9BACT|nr:thermonuclease family protein [Segetibacter aerophilus]GEO11793.1 hypothetical protein SAE01_42890 [Segetibacter aerophilus]
MESRYKSGDTISGKVVRIIDGDTFTLLTADQKQEKIRLYGIDCPERKQPFGTVAKERLSELVFGKSVHVEFKTYDRWKRIVGVVFYEKENINESVLKCGLAWHFTKYDDNSKWRDMEKSARQKKIGLWADAKPVPPWEWRNQK